MSKFQRSWNLFVRSLRVVGDNKKLLVFPLVTTVFVCMIVLFFLAPVALFPTGHAITEAAHWEALANRWGFAEQSSNNAAGYSLFAGIYLLSMFVSTFFNVAFYNEILNALNDRPVSVTGGLKFALSRLKAILVWSLFAGVVGLVIKSLEERVGLFGKLVVRLIGIGWSVASIFVIPAIVREENRANPVQFLRSSASLLKKTWGESLIGYVGIGFGSLFLALGSILWLALTVGLGWMFDSGWLMLAAAIVWLVSLFAFSYILNVAGQVYRGALFIYATEGVVPGPFDQEQMDMAWKIKSGRKAQ